MSSVIVDPFDESFAIGPLGEKLSAMRLLPTSAIANVMAPTVAELAKLRDAPIVCYSLGFDNG